MMKQAIITKEACRLFLGILLALLLVVPMAAPASAMSTKATQGSTIANEPELYGLDSGLEVLEKGVWPLSLSCKPGYKVTHAHIKIFGPNGYRADSTLHFNKGRTAVVGIVYNHTKILVSAQLRAICALEGMSNSFTP